MYMSHYYCGRRYDNYTRFAYLNNFDSMYQLLGTAPLRKNLREHTLPLSITGKYLTCTTEISSHASLT